MLAPHKLPSATAAVLLMLSFVGLTVASAYQADSDATTEPVVSAPPPIDILLLSRERLDEELQVSSKNLSFMFAYQGALDFSSRNHFSSAAMNHT